MLDVTENLAHKLQASLNYTLIFSLHRLLTADGRWVYDNPHTQYTLTNAVAVVYMTDWALKYDWRRRLSHMQMTDSDFTVNDWRRCRPLMVQ